MYKNKYSKYGYISIEYVILASIVGAFAVVAFILIWPRSAKKPFDVSNNELVAVIGGDTGNKVGGGGGAVLLPEATATVDFEVVDVTGGVAIKKYLGSNPDVVIPSQINNKTVVEISASAFANKAIESVLIPSTIKKIGARAFDSNQLTEIDLSNVEEIGEYAFTNNKLKSVRTHNLKRIPNGAFMKNELLTVIIDNKVEIIGSQAFSNNYLQIVDLPESVIQIGSKAFFNNEISTVYVSSTVSSMGDDSFDFQEGFVSGVVFVEGAFNRFDHTWDNIFDAKLYKETREEFKCTKLSANTCALSKYNGSSLDVVIPSEIDGMVVVEINDRVFFDRGINSVSMPNTIQSIGASAFEGNNLIQLNLPTSVRSIGTRAFANNSLKAITISDSLTSIGASAFAEQNCVNGAVIMSDVAYSRFSANWNSIFDSKLQRTK